VFTPDNLPAGLRSAHTTKDGTWGLLKVHAGVLRYTLDDPPHTEVVLAAGQQVVIEPQVRHHVAFELPGSFQITFCRAGDAEPPAPGGA
jgi:hemoglobin